MQRNEHVAAQTAPKFYLLQWGMKPTVPDRCNPANLYTLALVHRGPHLARCAALVARRADVYRSRSSELPTSGKEILTRFGPRIRYNAR
jgi:hypothetical protein